MTLSRGSIVVCGVVLLLAAEATAAFAQGGATSPLSGIVVDTSGGALPGANVVVRNNATSEMYNAVTNNEGAFIVPALVNGSYSVTVSLDGFKTAVLSAVTVNAATPASVKVSLDIGELAETVVVQSEASAIVQTQSPAVTATMDVNQISNLPLTSRSALDFTINLAGFNTPGGSRDTTVNGLPQGSINITIDGMSVQDNQLKTTDGFFARVSPRLDAVDEVTVSMAAQGAEATGTGAVQIRFVTRSGTNNFVGSSYYNLRHYKFNANTWFNNRDGLSKAQNITHQPGTRVGGPIVIPGFDGRNRAFFFVNFEEQRTPGELSRNRTILHPNAQTGVFRYNAGGQLRQVNLFALAAANGHVSTIDPTVARVLGEIRSATTTTGTISDLTDPLVERYAYQVATSGLTRYPTGRVDVNVTSKHRLYGSFNVTDLMSNPDTLNNSEPTFPGLPGTGFQDSFRYATQVSLRSTLSPNLVNELRVGGTGGATKFSPNRTSESFEGLDGFQLNLNGACCGTGVALTNARPGATYQAREASTKVIDNTLNWLKGSHNLQMGLNVVQGDVWIINSTHVPTINFAPMASNDPADAIFNTTNFPGASTANLTAARGLYGLLTGRIVAINGEVRLDESSNQYVFLGPSTQRAQLRDYGFFVSDTWRWKPNLTINAGLRYVVQTPFYPQNDSYSTAAIEDVFGVSGVDNLFKPGVLTGKTPEFRQFKEGERAYKTDWNNFAPNIGFAWSAPASGNAFLRRIFGAEEGDSVIRAGYSVSFQRPGMSDFTAGIDDNPGLSLTANRNHSLNNLGTPGGVFLRNNNQLGPPPFPTSPQYPMTDIVDEDVHIFAEDLQIPWARTWTAGWQRKLTDNLAFEARYVGSSAGDQWQDYNYNEINIVENGFVEEFRLAQQNLQANIASGRGANFRYFGPGTGTAPLPIFLAYFSGLPASQASSATNYSSALFANSTFVNPLARFNPQPFIAANALDAEQARRANALRAGLPANFLVVNPDLLGGAEVTGNGGGTKYHSLQLELRKRLSHNLQLGANYTFGRGGVQNFFSFRRPWEHTRDTGAEGEVAHAFKTNWVYELPFGRGQRFGGGAGAALDRLIGGWSFDGIARIQTGRLIDFGNVRLVGMTLGEFRQSFKLRFDDAGRAVYMLPQDIIDNTVKAFNVSATSLTGYGADGPPSGRYLAPANGPDCIEVGYAADVANNVNRPHTAFGDCGAREVVTTGPPQIRFDLSIGKRIPVAGRVRAEFRAELLNAFNRPWFVPVGLPDSNTPYTTVDSFRLTALSGETTSRVVQFVTRIHW